MYSNDCLVQPWSAIAKIMDRAVEEWKSSPLRVAVIGSSGSGKSSFINTFRGIPPSHPSAARVGVIETTLKVIKYQCQQHKDLVLYDVPGMGTCTIPQ